MRLFSSNPSPEELRKIPAYPSCDCFAAAGDSSMKWVELEIHNDIVDFESDDYRQLSSLIALTAERGSKEFTPRKELGWDLWSRISRLPPTISLMDRVEKMDLYCSYLVAIPREIMQMKSLVEFDPYTSYRLHWLPYEIARCPALRKSRISTRALYGNTKIRAPYPRLPQSAVDQRFCSVCDVPLEHRVMQRWIRLGVATDRMPLLVNACSRDCLDKISTPEARPHEGGLTSRPAKEDRYP